MHWQGAAVRSMAENSNQPLMHFMTYTFDMSVLTA
jgi:hypothetical protein